MEHDRCSEASAIAVTAGHALDALDLGVDRLCASVSGLVSDGVDDARPIRKLRRARLASNWPVPIRR